MFEESTPKRFYTLGAVLFFVTTVGTVGYKMISNWQESWLDCLYMTIITITTVGYGEVIDLEHIPHGRAFTLALLIMGMGVIAYFVSTLTYMIVEGDLNRYFRRRKLMHTIDSYEDHYICCGCGDTGIFVANELLATGRKLVVIETDIKKTQPLLKMHPGKYIPVVEGDATEDQTLRSAGIEKAKGLASCLGLDKDNLIVVYTCHEIDKEEREKGSRKKPLRIISRASSLAYLGRMKKAGAHSAISPNFIGGLRMVSEMIRPTVVTFLDKMLRDKEKNLRVEEVTVPEKSSYIGKTIADLNPRKYGNLVMLAIELPGSDDWIYNPATDTVIEKGMIFVFMGSPEGRVMIEQELFS